MAADILIVDDEADIREGVAGILSDEGHGTRTAKNSDEALAAIEARRPHLVFLDIWMQGSRLDGLQLLNVIKENHPTLPVVMISGHGNIETAVSAINSSFKTVKKGSSTYLVTLIRTVGKGSPTWTKTGLCKIAGGKLVAPKKVATCTLTLNQRKYKTTPKRTIKITVKVK